MLSESRRRDVGIKIFRFLPSLLADNLKLVATNDFSAQNFRDGQHSGGIGNNHTLSNSKLLHMSRERAGCQNGMLSFLGNLILAQLGYKIILPSMVVLRVIDNRAALLAIVKHYMNDVRAGGALGHATDLISPKRLLEFLKKLDFFTVTEFYGSTLLHMPLHFLKFNLEPSGVREKYLVRVI